jgi:hypothetical protein
MEVLYHIRPYFAVRFPYIRKEIWALYMAGTSNQSVPEIPFDQLSYRKSAINPMKSHEISH